MADDNLQAIINLAKDGYRATAMRELLKYMQAHPESAEGWYTMARLLDEPPEKYEALQKALALQKDYPAAQAALEKLLKAHPELGKKGGSKRRLLGVLLVIVLIGIAGVLALNPFDQEPNAPEVIIIVPTASPSPEIPPPTQTPVIVTSAPSLDPTSADNNRFIPTEAPQEAAQAVNQSVTQEVAPVGIVSATPPPSSTPNPNSGHTELAQVVNAPSQETQTRVLIAPLNSSNEGENSNRAAQLFAALAPHFADSSLYLEALESSVSDAESAAQILQSEEASLIIYGAAAETRLTLNLYAEEEATPNLNDAELARLNRLASPWALTLELEGASAENPTSLRGILGYVGGLYDVAIDGLSPLFVNPNRFDETEVKLAFMLGYSYQAVGRHDEALRLYDSLTTYLDAPDPRITANRALAMAQTGDAVSALALYNSILDSHPDPAFIQVNMGLLYARQAEGRPSAEIAFNRALELDPEYARAYLERGRLLAASDAVAAIADFEAALALESDYAAVYYERARLYAETDDRAGALADSDRARRLAPNNPDYQLLYADLLLADGQTEAGLLALENAGQLGAAGVYQRLAGAYYAAGAFDEALRAANNAIGEDQEEAEVWYQRGRVYVAQNQFESALEDFDQGLRRDPDHVGLRVARCALHVRLGNDGLAAADCDAALALDPQNGRALEQRGLIRVRAGDRGGAVDDFNEALDYESRAYEALYHLALFALQEGRYAEAIQGFTRTIEVAPFLGKAYQGRGVAYRISGAWELAIPDLQQALVNDPDDLYPLYELGLARRFLADSAFEANNRPRAIEFYEASAEAFLTFLNASQPDDPFVAEALQGLAYVNNALATIQGR